MAVVVNENSMENVVLCAEFISSLKVANLYIGFNEDEVESDVKQVICARHSVTVTLNADQMSRTVTWTDPIHLLPNTCSRITHVERGLLVRCNFEDDDNSDVIESENLFVSRYDQIRCSFCGNDFMKAESKPITTRVPISALGLSKDFDWEQMSMSYFCHDHGCGSETVIHEESEPPVCVKNTFGPQITEYFDCETYLVFNDDVIDRTKTKIDETGVKVACLRCHKQIGEIAQNVGTLKFFCDAITEKREPFSSANDGCEIRILANILRSCERRLLFVNEDGRTLSVIIMDKRLKTMQVRFEDQTTKVKSVCKLLYKPNTSESLSDNVMDKSVKVVKLHIELFLKVIGLLTKSTNQLPPALRFADDYYIAYVPYF